jgi:hypothetical protein
MAAETMTLEYQNAVSVGKKVFALDKNETLMYAIRIYTQKMHAIK